MPAKKRDFASAAKKKGFIELRKGDHIFYRYTDVNGNIIDTVHTKISHGGNGDISDSLLASMKKQMAFDTKEDLLMFIECSFSGEKYRNMINDKFGKS